MAFPTTSILDDFNRANQGPPPSSNWTSLQGGLIVTNNQCAGNAAGFHSARWNSASFTTPEIFCTIPVLFNYGEDVNLIAADASYNGYLVDLWRNNTTGVYVLETHRMTGGGLTIIDWTIVSPSAGCKIGMRIDGDYIESYIDLDGASGFTLVDRVLDTAYRLSFNLILGIDGTTARVDDFGGGTYVPASGLSIPVAMHHYRQMRN